MRGAAASTGERARGTRLRQQGQASLKGHRRRELTELASPRKFPGKESCSCTAKSDSIDEAPTVYQALGTTLHVLSQ